MWPLIAALISSILGFGTGLISTYNQPGQPGANLIPTPQVRACYNPQPNIQITLNWPKDFTNVLDYRRTLNPNSFGNVPPTFSSIFDSDNNGTPDCQQYLMTTSVPDGEKPLASRNYFLVRENLRISSCKTDELAGPYGDGDCASLDFPGPLAGQRHRGLCDVTTYPDLRKVAQITQDAVEKEIFWTPFSYNVGCKFEQDNNCGPGTNGLDHINMKDFIYVLRKRDAFDAATNPGCPVLWDAGSTNEGACSHYFDVYMAEDLYNIEKTAPPTDDPDSVIYFIRTQLQQCQEESTFTPLPESTLDIPPSFIRTPFLEAGTLGALPDKINPYSKFARDNYQSYVWSKPKKFVADVTNLIKTIENQMTMKICLPGGAKTDCYDPIGEIDFLNQNNKAEEFKVYSRVTAPETFVLVKKGNEQTKYSYMITNKNLPTNASRDPTLQLRNMEFVSQNRWTWATPTCKPAIYLYPEKPTDLTVKLELAGQLTESDPLYNNDYGWQVRANPDGSIRRGNSSYPYLYYEALLSDVEIPEEGWVFAKEEIGSKLREIMQKIGFNEKEEADFMAYWLPRLNDKPYYFVTMIPENIINQKEKLTLSLEPDTLIRVRFIFEGLDNPISVKAPDNISSQQRSGFTVADWGAAVVGKSCKELLVR